MEMKSLKRPEAQQLMQEWIKNSSDLPEVDSYYESMRSYLQECYKKVKEQYTKDYDIDIHFGMYLYDYLSKESMFNMRTAADDGFWWYISLKVIPDIVSDRWGKDNEVHFWKRSTKIWGKSLWWYIYLSWQGDREKTLDVIESGNCTTDTILNLLDRSGKGYYISTYRYIMYFYSKVSKSELSEFNKNTKTERDNLFRVIMRLHTARTKVINPVLYDGGEKEYARSLFFKMGINV